MHPIKMPTSKAKVYVCWNCIEDLEQQKQKEDKDGSKESERDSHGL
jgi:hypothetical protein